MRRYVSILSWTGVAVALLPLFACSGAQRPDVPRTLPPKVSGVEIYEAESWRVELARLEGGERALLRFSGTGDELDGIPLIHELEASETTRRWVTQLRGRERSGLYAIRDLGDSDEPRYRIHPPNSRESRAAERVEEIPEGLGEAIARRYAELLDEGVIERLQRYDRQHEIELEEEELSESVLVMRARCDVPELVATIDWETVGDRVLLTQSLSARCDAALSAIRQLCEREGAKEWMRSQLDRVDCSLDEEAIEPELGYSDRAIKFRFSLESVDLDQKARTALLALPDERFGSLGAALNFRSARVCQDELGRYFTVISPDAEPGDQLAYGTRDGLSRIPYTPGIGLGWFFDPRSFNRKHSDAFRGYDLRFFSKIEVDGGQCRLSCGERERLLPLASDEMKAALLKMDREASPFDRIPHALARDKAGIYYYVDRGNTPETAKDFRLYRGPRGALKQLEIRDVLSGNEEIFESRTGALRLLLDRDEAAWHQGRRREELIALPIEENLGVIFNELGIYAGRPLGVPCDDL